MMKIIMKSNPDSILRKTKITILIQIIYFIMALENLITVNFTAEELSRIDGALTVIESVLRCIIGMH
jgi:hypothetical protein